MDEERERSYQVEDGDINRESSAYARLQAARDEKQNCCGKMATLLCGDFLRITNGRKQKRVGPDGESIVSETEKTPLIVRIKRFGVHVALGGAVALYIVLGALMFQFIERAGTAEDKRMAGVKELLDKIRTNLPQNVSEDIELKLRDILTDLTGRPASEADLAAELLQGYSENGTLSVGEPVGEIAGTDMYSWTSFPSAMLFSFSAVSTIGYGHIYPLTGIGRLVCVLYTICGIPLFMISVADVGKFVWETIGFFFKSKLKGDSVGELPLSVSVPILICSFLSYILLGALLIPLVEQHLSFVDALYFSFISMTTVGFGDIIPLNAKFLPLTLFYIFFGLALTTLAIEVLATALRRFHYFGAPIKGAKLASVWVGGKLMNLDTVLRSMAREFGVSEDEMANFGDNLDQVLEQAQAEVDATGKLHIPDPPDDKRRHLQNGVGPPVDSPEMPRKFSGEYDNIPESWKNMINSIDFADDRHDDEVPAWMLQDFAPDNR